MNVSTHNGSALNPPAVQGKCPDHSLLQHALGTFAVGLRKDLTAVTAGLTLAWSSGAVEGNVTRIKLLKRQHYGRAGFALLRRHILLAH